MEVCWIVISNPNPHQHHNYRNWGGAHQSQKTLSVGELVVNKEEGRCGEASQGGT